MTDPDPLNDLRRVAALYDIHGNLPALEAVLAEVVDEAVDLIVVGGDVVPGPMPYETVSALLDCPIPVRFIRGNGENDVLATARGKPPARVPPPFRELIGWTAAELGAGHLKRIGGWAESQRIVLPELGRVLFCHATPRDDNELFTRHTPAERLAPVFASVDADLVVCGHTHMPFDRRVGSVRVVNAGSVGMPFGAPGAHWLILGTAVETRRTDYDFVDANARIRRTDYPDATGFDVQNPPSADVMLNVFESSALGGSGAD